MKKKTLNLKDYQEYLSKDNYESIYQDLINKTINLATEILKLKNIELVKEKDIDILYTIKFTFRDNFWLFKNMTYLVQDLITWDYEGNDLWETPKEKLEKYLNLYNDIIETFDKYMLTKKEIKEQGYQKLFLTYQDKFTNLFDEMLDYKKINYDKKIELNDLITKIALEYNYYEIYLNDLKYVINYQSIYEDSIDDFIDLDEQEVIIFLKELYQIFTDKDNDYHVHLERDY